MYVTNLTPTRLGISGPIVLSPHEKNRYLDESDKKIMSAVMRLKSGNFISYVLDAGLTKTSPAISIKKLDIDANTIDNNSNVIKTTENAVENEDTKKTVKKEDKPVADDKVTKKENQTSTDKKVKKLKNA